MTRYFKLPAITPDPNDGDPFVEWESDHQPTIDVYVNDDLTFTGLFDEKGQPIYRTERIPAGFGRHRG